MNYGNVEEFSDRLSEFTLEGKWVEVEEMYNKFPECHTVMIADFVGTALHVAVDLNKEDVVEKLVNAIIRHDTMVALLMSNDRGILVEPVNPERQMEKILKKLEKKSNDEKCSHPDNKKCSYPDNYTTLCEFIAGFKSLGVLTGNGFYTN
ncbi:hypothetical protein V8G54_036309 [Vigna mungo]|uniref:Uncharacterized protein n=1 Tax=Vigna mungo TaxID=3915 RepID=A0AAQ3MGU1_VIGMU